VCVCVFVCGCVARLAERMGLASGMLGRAAGADSCAAGALSCAAGALSYRIPLSY
jgi:hypothetical protein